MAEHYSFGYNPKYEDIQTCKIYKTSKKDFYYIFVTQKAHFFHILATAVYKEENFLKLSNKLVDTYASEIYLLDTEELKELGLPEDYYRSFAKTELYFEVGFTYIVNSYLTAAEKPIQKEQPKTLNISLQGLTNEKQVKEDEDLFKSMQQVLDILKPLPLSKRYTAIKFITSYFE